MCIHNIVFKFCTPLVLLFFYNIPSLNLHICLLLLLLCIYHVFVLFEGNMMPRFPRLPVVEVKARPKQVISRN